MVTVVARTATVSLTATTVPTATSTEPERLKLVRSASASLIQYRKLGIPRGRVLINRPIDTNLRMPRNSC